MFSPFLWKIINLHQPKLASYLSSRMCMMMLQHFRSSSTCSANRQSDGPIFLELRLRQVDRESFREADCKWASYGDEARSS